MLLKFKTYRTTKNRLWNQVRPMSQAEFQDLINPIIADVRNIALELAKKQTFLRSDEVQRFLLKIGAETDGKTVVVDASHTNKQLLRKKVPYISTHEFNALLNPIIAKHRKMDIGRAKYRRYLMPSEVTVFLREIGEVFDV